MISKNETDKKNLEKIFTLKRALLKKEITSSQIGAR